MMVVMKQFNVEMLFGEYSFHTLVLENKKLFRQVSYSFDADEPEEFFVFSKNYEPFEFRKKGMYIPNPINLEMNNKKLAAKITAVLEQMANDELYTEFLEIKNKLMEFAEKLSVKSDFCMDYHCDITAKDIIKLFGFEITRGDVSFEEAFVRYVLLVAQYLGVTLFVVSDLHLFFGKDELDMMFETLHLNGVKMLCIEGTARLELSDYEKIHIVDDALCEIE